MACDLTSIDVAGDGTVRLDGEIVGVLGASDLEDLAALGQVMYGGDGGILPELKRRFDDGRLLYCIGGASGCFGNPGLKLLRAAPDCGSA